MCGIAAYTGRDRANPDKMKLLILDNRERGTHSTGVFGTQMYKSAIDPLFFIRNPSIEPYLRANRVIAHTRFATMGDKVKENAHPFRYGELVGAHNGWLIPGEIEKICKKFNYDEKEFNVDSKLIFYHLEKSINGIKDDTAGQVLALRDAIQDIEAAMAIVFIIKGRLYIYRRESKPLYMGVYSPKNIYFSSRKEGLLAASIDEKSISMVDPDILSVYENGQLIDMAKVDKPSVKINLDEVPWQFNNRTRVVHPHSHHGRSAYESMMWYDSGDIDAVELFTEGSGFKKKEETKEKTKEMMEAIAVIRKQNYEDRLENQTANYHMEDSPFSVDGDYLASVEMLKIMGYEEKKITSSNINIVVKKKGPEEVESKYYNHCRVVGKVIDSSKVKEKSPEKMMKVLVDNIFFEGCLFKNNSGNFHIRFSEKESTAENTKKLIIFDENDDIDGLKKRYFYTVEVKLKPACNIEVEINIPLSTHRRDVEKNGLFFEYDNIEGLMNESRYYQIFRQFYPIKKEAIKLPEKAGEDAGQDEMNEQFDARNSKNDNSSDQTLYQVIGWLPSIKRSDIVDHSSDFELRLTYPERKDLSMIPFMVWCDKRVPGKTFPLSHGHNNDEVYDKFCFAEKFMFYVERWNTLIPSDSDLFKSISDIDKNTLFDLFKWRNVSRNLMNRIFSEVFLQTIDLTQYKATGFNKDYYTDLLKSVKVRENCDEILKSVNEIFANNKDKFFFPQLLIDDRRNLLDRIKYINSSTFIKQKTLATYQSKIQYLFSLNIILHAQCEAINKISKEKRENDESTTKC